jgi:hypothetical protein
MTPSCGSPSSIANLPRAPNSAQRRIVKRSDQEPRVALRGLRQRLLDAFVNRRLFRHLKARTDVHVFRSDHQRRSRGCFNSGGVRERL